MYDLLFAIRRSSHYSISKLVIVKPLNIDFINHVLKWYIYKYWIIFSTFLFTKTYVPYHKHKVLGNSIFHVHRDTFRDKKRVIHAKRQRLSYNLFIYFFNKWPYAFREVTLHVLVKFLGSRLHCHRSVIIYPKVS